MTEKLSTIIDFIRYAASRFAAAGVCFGHSHDNAIDEAAHLVLSSLALPPDLPPAYAQGRLTGQEREHLLTLIEQRIERRTPVAYLVGEVWFAGLRFKSDPRALVPRSPIAELIEEGFGPWLEGRKVQRVLDLCTGSGCIGIAMAVHYPDWQVDLSDISKPALHLAQENIEFQHVSERAHLVESDLFANLQGERYHLIVSNPPYVSEAEYVQMPDEYGHEPKLGLTSGEDGLNLPLRMLDEAANHLFEDGLLIVEVGESERALTALLPDVPFVWLDFKVGSMGVFLLDRKTLQGHAPSIRAVAQARHR